MHSVSMVILLACGTQVQAQTRCKGIGTDGNDRRGGDRHVWRTCTRQIGEIGKRRQWRRALQLFHSMQRHGVVPDVITYSALISACEKGNEPDRALKLFEAMKQQGIVPDVIIYNALISACEKGQQPERALELFEAMK